MLRLAKRVEVDVQMGCDIGQKAGWTKETAVAFPVFTNCCGT